MLDGVGKTGLSKDTRPARDIHSNESMGDIGKMVRETYEIHFFLTV